MRRTEWIVSFLLLVTLGLCVPGFAQRYTGTISGVTTDAQGAVVAGAQVTITNQATGASRVVTTTSSGLYAALELDPGTYTVRIKAGNFKEFVAKDVTVDPASTATVNATLQVGNATEQITVEASTIQVETTTGAVGNVINGTEVRELPLNGNNFMELTQLVPGVSSLSDFNTVKKGLEGNSDFSVNGNLTTGNIFMVDGVNNNDIGSNRTILIYPSIQAIDEFKILRNSYGAEYGQAAGAIVNIVTRSGTNSWHGGASYYGRNTALNATDYFTNLFRQSNPLIHKDVVHRNDALFNIGGPIIKDKLFFFESEEWNREIRGATRAGAVPTLLERSGDFTDIADPTAPVGAKLANPACPTPFPTDGKIDLINGGTTQTWEPYFGPGIPNVVGTNGSTLSPFGLNYMGNFPLPNLSSPVDCANWAQSVSEPVHWREDHVRGDWNITPTLKLFARYTRDTWDNPFPSTLQYWGEDIWPQVGDHWNQPSSQATVKLTKLLGPSAVNDLQLSYATNAISVFRTGAGVGGNYYTAPGVLAPALSPNAYIQSVDQLSLPYFPLSGKAYPLNGSSTGLGEPGFWANGPVGVSCITGGCQGALAQEGPWHNNEQLLILKDDFSKVSGSHTFRVGFIATSNQKNQRLQNESLGENAQYWSTTADSWGGPSSSQNGVFDMLNKGTQWGFSENSTNAFELMRWHDYEFYGADNWKIRRNVTIDYGVRWSFLRNAYNGNGQMGWWEPNLFNPNLTANGTAQVNSPCNGMLLTRTGLALCQGAGLAGGALSHDTGLIPNNNHLVQPRIGIAWDVRGDGKTAIRAGFGTFYNRFMLNTAMAGPGNPPFVFGLPSSISQRPFDNPGPAFSGVLGDKPNIGVAQNDHIPESIQYNLTIEHQLFANTKLEIGYVGNQGRFLETILNANMPQSLAGRIAYAESSFGGSQKQSLTPYGALTGWGAIQFASFSGVSHYDSVQALFKTKMKAVDAQFAYTYSKSLASTDISDSSGSQQSPNTLLANDPHSDYGPSIINRPHIFAGNVVYNAPKLEGQNAFLRAALGAWETSAILQYTSGPSITVFANGGSDLVGSAFNGADRPNLVRGQSCRPHGGGENVWLNSAMFTLDHYQIGTLPSSPRGVCLGPGLANTDFSVRKNFKITERVNAKFSLDFFNLFNKTQFLPSSVNTNLSNGSGMTLCTAANIGTANSPCTTAYSPNTVAWNPATNLSTNFGKATGDRFPRQVQYGLKVEF